MTPDAPHTLADQPEEAAAAPPPEPPFGRPGPPLEHTPFYVGLLGGLGLALAIWLATRVMIVSSSLILIVVAFFIAVGLSPAVEFFIRHGLKRAWALIVVICCVLAAIALFSVAIVPVISDQVGTITSNAPAWLDQLEHNKLILRLNEKYDLIGKLKDYISSGHLWTSLFGGAINVGLKILGLLASTFVVVVLTLYFLASLDTIKRAAYSLAPASRRPRVSRLGDEILRGVGGYVSGAFMVAMCAGISTLIFLFIVGMGQYAVALAVVVALLDVIPMIGATLGAVIVCAIGFATDVKIGIACVIFYIVYQQIENYLIYPKVMSRSVEIPGSVTVIAALIGAGLLGVVGALLAIPTAAAILLLVREVFIKRQDAR
ncbi:AI-2E family transporter [Nocardioides terrisoli]|uniref:AI-2E family transporter n=1 Tax=Nocardioides terrisoli TaxID=3388267 RepID=UPI00287B76C9|nr:AI-2E family transporter [Nocardioides marmorisolisilvae]